MCAITSACKISQPYIKSTVSKSHRLHTNFIVVHKRRGRQWRQYLTKEVDVGITSEGGVACVFRVTRICFLDRLFTFSTKDLVSYSRCKQIPPLLKIVPYGRLR